MKPLDFRIPVTITESAGRTRHRGWVRIGVPLPEGEVQDPAQLVVEDEGGRLLPRQARVLASWSDRSIRWLLLDALVDVAALGTKNLILRRAGSVEETQVPDAPRAIVTATPDRCVVDTGRAVFELRAGSRSLVDAVRIDGVNRLTDAGIVVRLTGNGGREYAAVVRRVEIEESGPIRVVILADGEFQSPDGKRALAFTARCGLLAGSVALALEFQVRNPRAAHHPGGLWDLADRGTVLFDDLSVVLTPAEPAQALRWYAEHPDRTRDASSGPWSLYQDSSGGENWDSPNHLDVKGRCSVRFRGYRVSCGERGRARLVAEGDRATPAVEIRTRAGALAATIADFWQNFPKALRWDGRALSIGLFPGESRSPHALQGGEHKRQTSFLEFIGTEAPSSIADWQQPLIASIDPIWVQRSRALESFIAASADHNARYLRYLESIIDGPHAFVAKRERIDEYGWRNFGDLYADHEAVRDRSARPLVSHYNNQYDFVHGALVHYLRSGDARWRQLGDEAARHTIDIDIYHTDDDRAAFNHGLFWHTDHHMAAATSTHRTYSACNGRGAAYGGGPGNEHNYTSGLLLNFYITGDPEAAAAVRELADWVIAMDDGSRSALGLIDPGPTGLASKTSGDNYHKAGRGAGNSINALLDGYQLSGDRPYLDKAEELIRRCIHPADDVDALRLTEPELRWSYLAFLQVLGKYLHLKCVWHEVDYMAHYARASLLHYARWMEKNEVPYKDVLHKVELPTETWPAQDVRKAHVLNLAADFAPAVERAGLRARARFFFDRCLEDVLSFETAYLTRPQVILCVYGYVQGYYDANPDSGDGAAPLSYSFGVPTVFESQKYRWRSALPARIRLLLAKVARAGVERLGFRRFNATPIRL